MSLLNGGRQGGQRAGALEQEPYQNLPKTAIFSGQSGFFTSVKMVTPAPLGKQRSRDAKDDPYLACALAARAGLIVSRDQDLLVLGKPFGVEIITPRDLLGRLAAGN